MNNPSDKDLLTKFAHAFAEAVVAFSESGEPQSLDYDAGQRDYVFGPMEPGSSPTDTSLYVGIHWRDLTGPVLADSNPEVKGYSAEALRAEVRDAATQSPMLLKLAVIVAEEGARGETLQLQPPSSQRSH